MSFAALSGFYEEWRAKRFAAIIEHYGEEFFHSKTLLELGAGLGDFGKMFEDIGAIVTSFEGRQENLNILKMRYPNRPTKLFNCVEEVLEEDYDVILHCGLLYHMRKINVHLKNCMKHCEHFILETELCDFDKSKIIYMEEPAGYLADTSGLTLDVSRPSAKYVENIFIKNGFAFEEPKNPSLINVGPYQYDWETENRGYITSIGFRKMWFCKRSK
jgi:hypothetical protein